MRKAYPNEIFHSSSPVVYRGKNYDKTAENDRYNRSYNTARMQTNANRRRKLTTGGRKDKA